MVSISKEQNRERMRALVEFTASSLETEFPSPFGAAIYDSQGDLIVQVFDTVIKDCDPTNHGEMNAIRIVTQEIQQRSLKGCIIYSTCEPCIMCMSAIIWAEIDMVVYGASIKEDASLYVKDALDITANELTSRMFQEPKCIIVPFVERQLCQDLFKKWKVAIDTMQLSNTFKF